MDVLLNADEQLLQNNAREFFERECPVSGSAHMTQDIYGKKFFPTPLNLCL